MVNDKRNWFNRNFGWLLLGGIGLILFPYDIFYSTEYKKAQVEAKLEQTLVNIHNRCMGEGYIENGFTNLKEYCTWRMAQYIRENELLGGK